MSAAPRAPGDIAADLRRLGVRDGDRLMVHASLRRIGAVEGGANGVIEALDAAVGPYGTLVMILGAVVEHEWVNQHPEGERAALLENAAPYDPLVSPVLPEVGYLAEAFRTYAGTLVDDNPSGRFAARGYDAADLLHGLPWDDYYGPDSVLARLSNRGGRILRMGANLDTVTALHHAEYLADVPGKRRVTRHYRVAGAHGPETRTVTSLDDEFGIVDWSGDDYFAIITRAYLDAGRAQRGRVGNADSELIEMHDIIDFGARWMSANLVGAR